MAEVIRALTLWDNIPSGSKIPDSINVIVEMPKGSSNRFAYDRKSGAFVLDGVLPQPFPLGDIGVIPHSVYDDGHPLAVAVLMGEPSFTGCVIGARPIGLLKVLVNGTYSDKVLAVPLNDPKYEGISEIEDLSEGITAVVAHFFAHSLGLEGVKVEVAGWKGADAAKKSIEHGINLYRKKSGSE